MSQTAALLHLTSHTTTQHHIPPRKLQQNHRHTKETSPANTKKTNHQTEGARAGAHKNFWFGQCIGWSRAHIFEHICFFGVDFLSFEPSTPGSFSWGKLFSAAYECLRATTIVSERSFTLTIRKPHLVVPTHVEKNFGHVSYWGSCCYVLPHYPFFGPQHICNNFSKCQETKCHGGLLFDDWFSQAYSPWPMKLVRCTPWMPVI